jgi:hypothetical protein
MGDLTKQLDELLERELIKQFYLRVSQGEDGRLAVEQVAFLRSQDLAALIHIDERTIRGWAKKNLIPSFKPPGSSVFLFDLNDVIRALKNEAALETGQKQKVSLRIAAP